MQGLSRFNPFRKPMISLVSAAYNVAPYIDAFCQSIVNQTYDLSNVEVILVDDGSTDDTRARALTWAHRYPRLFRVIHRPNGGVAVARNLGMDHARGTWISFPDTDDILHTNYLTECIAAIQHAGPAEKQIAVVANLVRYIEATDQINDTHPMRYRFAKGMFTRPVIKTRDRILQSVSHALFRRAPIVAHGLRFDSTIQPTFEDGQFANALLILEADKLISFVPEAVYYYRKRALNNSAVDQSQTDVRWFTTQLDTGYLSLIRLARQTLGSVPPFIQINCLYSMLWRFRYLMNSQERAALLTPQDRVTMTRHLDAIFAEIDPEILQNFARGGSSELHRTALLARYKNQSRVPLRIQPEAMNDAVFAFHWYSPPEAPIALSALVDGQRVEPDSITYDTAHFLDQPYVTCTTVQLLVAAGQMVSFVQQDNSPVCFRDRGKDLGPEVSYNQLTQLKPVPVKPS